MIASITVVINTLNRSRLLEAALTGVMRQRYRRFEVVVVDGPSLDDTSAVLTRFPGVRIGHCPHANLSMSRNIGVAMARGEVIAFLDDDAVPEPTWLERLAARYDAADVGGVGGFIRDRTGIGYQSRVTVCDRFGDAQDFARMEDAELAPGDGRYFSPTGANASYRRAALLQIGGFDETFTYFLEETDVNLRLHEAGWRLSFASDAQVHHKLAGSARRDDRNVPISLYEPCRSKAYFAMRHGPGGGLDAVLSRLADHGVSLFGHNRALLDYGLIDAEHRARLDADVQRGLSDGAALGFQGRRPPLLDAQTLRIHAGERFTPITLPILAHRRLRIAFATRQYPPGVVGGIGVWTETAARALAARGHEVSVITAGDAPSISFEHGVWVHRVMPTPAAPPPGVPDLPQTVIDYACAVRDAVAEVLDRRGLDVFSWPIWDLEGLAVHASGALPTVVSLHTTYALAAPFKPEWAPGTAYRRDHVDKVIAAETTVLDTAPVVLANSRQVVEDVERVCAARLDRPGVVVVPHGLRDRSAGVQGIRRDDRVQILFVGRLEARKGVDVFLDALAEVLPRHPQVYARVVGEVIASGSGDTAPQMFARRFGTASWADRVSFEGAVDAERLDQAYADCDIFVAPSRYESFGLVFVEAMMFAKPCIGAKVGGVAEVVIEGRTGLLPRPGDVSALAAAMVALIEDPGLRRRMGAAGRARYLAEFTDVLMAQRLETVYQAAIVGVAQAARDLSARELSAV